MENQLHAERDKLFTEIDHLDRVLDRELTPAAVDLALMVAKRARRSVTILVQQLAVERDKLATANGGTSE